MSTLALAHEVVQFWVESGPAAWFTKDAAFDRRFHDRFYDLHMRAARREFDHWTDDAEGCYALLILLDQFPRNCFRNTGHMYATDSLARHYARLMLSRNFDEKIPVDRRVFCYLPFSHSELLSDQEIALAGNRKLGRPWLDHAEGHLDIVKRFGRFPHRNQILARDTTPEEQAFLDAGGFSG